MPSIDEATALARRALQMFNDRDVDCFVSCFTADAEWWPLRSATEGAYTGPEGIRAWFRETDELFDYIQAELGEVESIGGAAVSDGQLHVRGKGSGATVDMPITWVFRFEGEQVAWARAYADRRRSALGPRAGQRLTAAGAPATPATAGQALLSDLDRPELLDRGVDRLEGRHRRVGGPLAK